MTKNRKKGITALVLTVIMCFAAGCAATAETAQTTAGTDAAQGDKKTIKLETEVSLTDGNDLLNDAQEQLLLEYAQLYANTAVTLVPQDISGLYYDTQSEEYHLNKTALEVLTTVRKMAEKDLKLEYCSVDYTVEDAYLLNSGTYVKLTENNVQKFSFMDTASESFMISHEFILKKTDEGWRIRSHLQEEDFYLLAAEAWQQQQGTAEEISNAVLQAVTADTEENLLWTEENYLNKTAQKTAKDTSYNRQEAIEYAQSWVGKRNYNGTYLAYDSVGGNCQNFASQCLHAGGIAMDSSGNSSCQWKFYSKDLNERQTQTGRSYSWTGVVPFFDYCQYNTSTGIVAQTDWGTAYTQPGDVIQVGAMGHWRHSLFVTDVVYNEEGYAEEIIVASNTADRINYPLSAYIYTAPRLIHIVGQNT